MASWKPTPANSTALAFRLRTSVRYHLTDDYRPVLILLFPLKIIYLHASFRTVADMLSRGKYLSLETIRTQVPDMPQRRIEALFKDLIRKGFMEQRGRPALAEDNCPFVSVIIPVRNRPREIEDCLNSLMNLDYPSDKIEIIVIDDASEDHTPQIIAQFPVRLIQLTAHKQASFCRNLGARHAQGTILAFIDSDCLAASQWLRELASAFNDVEVCAVGGRIDAHYQVNGLDRYEKVKSSLKISDWYKRSDANDRFFYAPACNFLVRKAQFLELGGFRESMFVGEDVDFCWRLQNQGYVMEYIPAGKIFHKHRNRLGSFCARRFEYGTSEPLLQQLHPDRKKQLFLPPLPTLFWLLFILAVWFKSIFLFLTALFVLLWDCIHKYRKIHARNLPIRFFRLSLAVARSYLAFFYHLCGFVSRYYLMPALLVFPFSSLFVLVVFCVHLLVGLTEYGIKKPRMNPFAFLFYFSLEQLAYQAGVWWGCFKRLNFNAVRPRVVFQKE